MEGPVRPYCACKFLFIRSPSDRTIVFRLELGTDTEKLGTDVQVEMTQLCFDGTFMGATVGLESCYIGLLNLNSDSKFQHASAKFALLPTYDKDAAAKHLSPQQIKKREMELHQACIGVIVRELNKHSNTGGEVLVQCPDERCTPC